MELPEASYPLEFTFIRRSEKPHKSVKMVRKVTKKRDLVRMVSKGKPKAPPKKRDASDIAASIQWGSDLTVDTGDGERNLKRDPSTASANEDEDSTDVEDEEEVEGQKDGDEGVLTLPIALRSSVDDFKDDVKKMEKSMDDDPPSRDAAESKGGESLDKADESKKEDASKAEGNGGENLEKADEPIEVKLGAAASEPEKEVKTEE